MYRHINSNIAVLFREIRQEDHIDPYVQISDHFRNQTNQTDEFERTFRKFYQLNAARLSDQFCRHYFELLQDVRDNLEISVFDVVRRLMTVPSNNNGSYAVHFSFASKLAHTINCDLPVYDSMVSQFYFLPDIKSNWDSEKKIAEYQRNYNFLVDEYGRIIHEGILHDSIVAFRDTYELPAYFSDTKVIDTLVWRFTAMLKSGAARNGEVIFS